MFGAPASCYEGLGLKFRQTTGYPLILCGFL
jgi:hypothetical protein